uniref:Candidate secreted effector n=1 Tax=Meloidogyne incognita TaxID=6306 RepID=A0A914LBC3_MELIC
MCSNTLLCTSSCCKTNNIRKSSDYRKTSCSSLNNPCCYKRPHDHWTSPFLFQPAHSTNLRILAEN